MALPNSSNLPHKHYRLCEANGSSEDRRIEGMVWNVLNGLLPSIEQRRINEDFSSALNNILWPLPLRGEGTFLVVRKNALYGVSGVCI